MATAVDLGAPAFLRGIFRPVDDERDEPDLPVTGEIPERLAGTFLRNGANPKFPPAGRYHLFDGDGMLHAVTLDAGRASYRNRWVRSAGLEAEERAGRALFGGLAANVPVDLEATGGVHVKNVANTHVIEHAGRILCLWEAGLPTEVTRELETVGPWDFHGALDGPMTAHPKRDPRSGELHFFGYSGLPPFLRYSVADAEGRMVHHAAITIPTPVMIHDFELTDAHAVFLDAPAVFTFEEFAKGGTILDWRPENGTRFGVLPRDGSRAEPVWIETEPCYVFHFLNAFDDGSRVVVDGCRLPCMDIGLDDDTGRLEGEGYLTRFTLDLDARTCREERIADIPGDFTRIPDAVQGRPYRYGYMATYCSGTSSGGLFDSISKVDVHTGRVVTQDFGGGLIVGEPVFAPDPGGTAEDDGWILTFVSDPLRERSEFVILDARTPDAAPVARVAMPRRIPFGFHGSWLPF